MFGRVNLNSYWLSGDDRDRVHRMGLYKYDYDHHDLAVILSGKRGAGGNIPLLGSGILVLSVLAMTRWHAPYTIQC